MPSRMATSGGREGTALTVIALTMPDRAIVAPMDRSMPPVSSTIIMPTARMPRIAVFLQQVLDVGKRQEGVIADLEQHAEDHDEGQEAQLAEALREDGALPHWATAMAAPRMSSWVACPVSRIAATRPSRMTTIRSLIPSTSGISEDTMMIP